MVRLNTYDTLPVSNLDQAILEKAKKAQVVSIASPSAVKAWVQLVGTQKEVNIAFACIGEADSVPRASCQQPGRRLDFVILFPGSDLRSTVLTRTNELLG